MICWFHYAALLSVFNLVIFADDPIIPSRMEQRHLQRYSNLRFDKNAVGSSFIDEEEQRQHWDQQSRSLLSTICNSNSAWLKCDSSIKYGAFGIGTKIEIWNDHHYGIHVYRNCRGKIENPTEAQFDVTCQVPSVKEPKLKGFLKVLKGDAEDANRFAFLPTLSAFDKEVRRTREFAGLSSADGVPFGPAIFDIRDVKTGQAHSLHRTAFIQEFVEGADAYNILDELQKSEFVMMRDNLDNVLCKLDNYQTALKTNQPQQAQLKYDEFKDSVVNFQKEFWMRGRLRVRAGWSVIVEARKLWEMGILHCDLHFSNMRFIKSHVRSINELWSLISSGVVYVPNVAFLHSSMTTIPASVIQYFSRHGEGAEIYLLDPTKIRFIDVSYAIRVHAILSEISGIETGQYGLNAEKLLQHPCRAYRSERHEDLLELVYGGGGEGGGLSTIFNVSSSTGYTNRFDYLIQTFKVPQSQYPCRRVLSHILENPSSIAAMAISSLRREASDIDRIFGTALRQMLSTNEYENCVGARKAWNNISSQQRSSAVRSVKPHEQIQRLIPQYSCSFYDIRQGGLRFQRIIEKAGQEFPPFTLLDLSKS